MPLVMLVLGQYFISCRAADPALLFPQREMTAPCLGATGTGGMVAPTRQTPTGERGLPAIATTVRGGTTPSANVGIRSHWAKTASGGGSGASDPPRLLPGSRDRYESDRFRDGPRRDGDRYDGGRDRYRDRYDDRDRRDFDRG